MKKGARITLDIDSINKMLHVTTLKLNDVSKNATEAVCRSIYEESLRLVPRDTDTLAKSAYYTVLGSLQTGFTGYIGYGGYLYNKKSRAMADAYMVRQHEDLSLKHTVGQAKFLEIPIKKYRSLVAVEVARLIGGELK